MFCQWLLSDINFTLQKRQHTEKVNRKNYTKKKMKQKFKLKKETKTKKIQTRIQKLKNEWKNKCFVVIKYKKPRVEI